MCVCVLTYGALHSFVNLDVFNCKYNVQRFSFSFFCFISVLSLMKSKSFLDSDQRAKGVLVPAKTKKKIFISIDRETTKHNTTIFNLIWPFVEWKRKTNRNPLNIETKKNCLCYEVLGMLSL